jgi:membrane-bound ClpP family serine protease
MWVVPKNRRLTTARLVLAVVSTAAEETAIYAVWRWLLPRAGIELPVGALIGAMVGWAVFSVVLFVVVTHILTRQKETGPPTMVGAWGKTAGALAGEGMVRIRGELWKARSAGGDIPAGESVEVVGEEGLTLVVRRAETKR